MWVGGTWNAMYFYCACDISRSWKNRKVWVIFLAISECWSARLKNTLFDSFYCSNSVRRTFIWKRPQSFLQPNLLLYEEVEFSLLRTLFINYWLIDWGKSHKILICLGQITVLVCIPLYDFHFCNFKPIIDLQLSPNYNSITLVYIFDVVICKCNT